MAMTMTKTTAPKLPGRWILPTILALWVLIPEVRRLVDWQVGFNSLPVINLTPLVALIPVGLLVFRRRAAGIPTPLAIVAAAWLIGFGFALLIALLSGGVLSALYQAAQFMLPICIAVVVIGRNQPTQTFRTVATTLAWLGLIVGAYGIFQYVSPPPWDVLWAQNSRLSSIGNPAPFEMRIFSTLNSPGVCGDFFALAFLAQLPYFRGRSLPWRLIAVAFIMAGLLLTADRSAWVATALGAIVFVVISPRRTAALAALVLVGVASVAAVASGASSLPALQTIQDRVTTLQDVQSDDSIVQRQQESAEAMHTALTEPIGQGLGSIGTATKLISGSTTTLDNGYLSRFLEMGVFGFIAYLFAVLGAALFTLIRAVQVRRESPEAATVAAACLAMQAGLLLLDISSDHHAAFAGTMFWIAVAVPLMLAAPTGSRRVVRTSPELRFAR